MLDLSDKEEKLKLKKEIYKNLLDLCQDQYGNYVIQHLLEVNKGKDCEEIFKLIKGKVFEMSTHKFASNIIERCLYFGSKDQKYNIIDEVLSKDDYLHDSIISLVKDKFGNYAEGYGLSDSRFCCHHRQRETDKRKMSPSGMHPCY